MGKYKKLNKLFKKLNRIEIITDNGRELVKRGKFKPMLQDDGETLKIVFVGSKKEKKKIDDDFFKLLNLDFNELKKGNMNNVPVPIPTRKPSIKNCWQCENNYDSKSDGVMIMDGENINPYYFCSGNCRDTFINDQDKFDGDGRPKKWNGV